MGDLRLDGLNTALLRPGERVGCAVSGGADSVALLHALLEANSGKEPLGLVLRAVHVHHGLRGAEADEDEAFVRDLCARHGVELALERVDTAARQAAAHEGIEEAARHLRYGVFWRLLASGWADTVVTAHTLDDQAETVLMKLLRGAWTEGLAGISPVLEPREAAGAGMDREGAGLRQGSVRQGSVERVGPAAVSGAVSKPEYAPEYGPGLASGRITRPLLGVCRAEIETFLQERGQPWRNDSSNADLRLTRNRIRQEILPLLRTINPAVAEALARTATLARDEEAYWQGEIARLLPGMVLPGKPVRGGGRAVSTAVGEQSLALELERLKGLPLAVRRRLVRATAARLGCRLGSEETMKLLALAGLEPAVGPRVRTGTRVGARLELRNGLRVERSARELRFSRSAPVSAGSTAEDVEKA